MSNAQATTDSSSKSHQSTMKGVWTIIDGPHREKSLWLRSGTAFVNRDTSINVYLDTLPTNGKLHIRDIEPRPAATTGN